MWSKIVTRINAAKGYTEDPGFPKPDSIIEGKICKSTGDLAVDGVCPHIITEYFAKGTLPTNKCSTHIAESQTKETATSTEPPVTTPQTQ